MKLTYLKKKQAIATPMAIYKGGRYKFSIKVHEIYIWDLMLSRLCLLVWDNILCDNKYYEWVLKRWQWVADYIEIPLACWAQMIGKTRFMYEFPVSQEFMLMYHKDFYEVFYPSPENSVTI